MPEPQDPFEAGWDAAMQRAVSEGKASASTIVFTVVIDEPELEVADGIAEDIARHIERGAPARGRPRVMTCQVIGGSGGIGTVSPAEWRGDG